jgi:hypothetical protein
MIMKSMSKLFITGLLIISACAPTNYLMYSRKAADLTPKKYTNIGIVAILRSDDARITIEDALAANFRSKGNHVTTTWSIWPFANNKEKMKQYGIEGEKLKEIIQSRVASQKMDALLIITLFDSKKETRYVPPTTTTMGVGVGFNPGMYPVYGYPYYSYYDYAFSTVTTPGYYIDASVYFTESNLYDIATEKLVWTGQVRTAMESSLESEAKKFSHVIVNALVDAGVLAR